MWCLPTHTWVLLLDHALTLGLWTPNAVMKTLTTTTMKTNAVVMFSSKLSWKCLLSSLRFHFTVGKDKRNTPYLYKIIMESTSNSYWWHMQGNTRPLSFALCFFSEIRRPTESMLTISSKKQLMLARIYQCQQSSLCFSFFPGNFNNAHKQQWMRGHFKCGGQHKFKLADFFFFFFIGLCMHLGIQNSSHLWRRERSSNSFSGTFPRNSQGPSS